MDYRAVILLYLELLLALAIVWREGLCRGRRAKIAALTLIPLAFALRYCMLTYETLDYQDWIYVWINTLREEGAWVGLGQEIWSCNYNVPYLYFLALISDSDIYDLLLVKLLSILFDVVLAFAVERLTGLLTGNSPARRLTAFLCALWLPTVVLNGALWGQCDVIYGALAVLALYLALADRPGWSVAAIALSVSFKLQGIFLLPVYFPLLLSGKVKIKHLFVFPAVYVLSILPAVLAGRDFWELLTLYISNTSTIGDGLNYNASSMYSLLDFSALDTTAAARIGIVLAFFFCAAIFTWFAVRQKDISTHALFGAAVMFCIGVPFLLPHMHDRYFFLADVLTLVLAVATPRFTPAAVLVSFGSFLGYHAYLKMQYLMPMKYGAAAMLCALVLAGIYTALRLRPAEACTGPGLEKTENI